MQRIRPKLQRAAILRNEILTIEDTISELGIFGTYVRKGNEICLNQSAGHLLRTKVFQIRRNFELNSTNFRLRQKMKEALLRVYLFLILLTLLALFKRLLGSDRDGLLVESPSFN